MSTSEAGRLDGEAPAGDADGDPAGNPEGEGVAFPEAQAPISATIASSGPTRVRR